MSIVNITENKKFLYNNLSSNINSFILTTSIPNTGTESDTMSDTMSDTVSDTMSDTMSDTNSINFVTSSKLNTHNFLDNNFYFIKSKNIQLKNKAKIRNLFKI